MYSQKSACHLSPFQSFFYIIKANYIKIFKYNMFCYNSGLFAHTQLANRNISILHKSHICFLAIFSHHPNILCHQTAATEHKVNEHSWTLQATRGTVHSTYASLLPPGSVWLCALSWKCFLFDSPCTSVHFAFASISSQPQAFFMSPFS